MNEETYKAKGYSPNCGQFTEVQVPKGMKVDDYFQVNNTCPHCGCDTLRRAKSS